MQIFVEVPGSSTSGASWTLASASRRRLGGGGGLEHRPSPMVFFLVFSLLPRPRGDPGRVQSLLRRTGQAWD